MKANLIACTSCKTPYNVLSHCSWVNLRAGGFCRAVDIQGGGGVRAVVQNKESPDFGGWHL